MFLTNSNTNTNMRDFRTHTFKPTEEFVKQFQAKKFCVTSKKFTNSASLTYSPKPNKKKDSATTTQVIKNPSIKPTDKSLNFKTKHRLTNIYTNITGKNFTVITSEQEYLEKSYYCKFYNFEKLNFIYSVISIVTGLAYYELSYNNTSESVLPLLYCISLLTILLWFNIVNYELTYRQYVNRIDESNISVYKSLDFWKSVVSQVLITAPHPFFWTHNSVYSFYNEVQNRTINYKVNSILCICLFLRFYYTFRFYIYRSGYISPEMNEFCRKHFFETTMLFGVKSLIFYEPQKMYSLVALIEVYFFAFTIRIFERELNEDFGSITSSIWFVLVTMTTVGYGDMISVSVEGRIFTLVACFSGVFLMSLMLLTLTNILSLSEEESHVFQILKKIKINKNLKQNASSVISKAMNLNRKKLTLQEKTNILSSAIHDFSKAESESNKIQGKNSELMKIISELNLIMKDLENEIKEQGEQNKRLATIDSHLNTVYEELINKRINKLK